MSCKGSSGSQRMYWNKPGNSAMMKTERKRSCAVCDCVIDVGGIIVVDRFEV